MARRTMWRLLTLLHPAALAVAAHLPFAQTPSTLQGGECTIDLGVTGQMRDVVSNVLLRGVAEVRRPEADVAGFLRGAHDTYATGPDLLRAAAAHFQIEEATLAAEVERFRHCNCLHGEEALAFARDVMLHVVLHEIGHAVVREFDLPVLGNEETMADAFATHVLTTRFPERAPEVLVARVRSLMSEARTVARGEWSVHGEHDNDARRAAQIAALAAAADGARYERAAHFAGLSERDVRRAREYGAEIHRSWRRRIAPLLMPAGERSNEVRIVWEEDPDLARLRALGFDAEIEDVLRSIDWHSQVTVRFVPGEGGAAWSRSSRTVTVHAGYLQRFVDQGRTLPIEAAGK